MKLAIIGCSHGRHNNLIMPEADVLIHTGDYSRRGDQWDARDFLRWLDKQPYRHKVFVDGNHDGTSEENPALFAQLMAKYAPSCHHLCDSGVILDGFQFWGSPVTPAFYDWWWNRERGAAIQAHWDKIPFSTEVLITHGPAMGVLDYVTDDRQHVGCEDLSRAIRRLNRLRLHAFSHIHGAYGKEVVESVYHVNASVCNEAYQPVNPPILIHLDQPKTTD